MTPDEFKAWRKRLGWTQEEAARQLETSRHHVLRMERGINAQGREMVIPRVFYLATLALEQDQDLRKK